MSDAAVTSGEDASPTRSRIFRSAMALAVLFFAVLALLSPLLNVEPQARAGTLLLFTAAIELMHGLRRSTESGRWAAWRDGVLSLLMAVALINAPLVASSALLVLLAITFAITGIAALLTGMRGGTPERSRWVHFARGGLNIAFAAVLITLGHRALEWSVAIAVALRIARAAVSIAVEPVFSGRDADETVLADLRLPVDPRLSAEAARLLEEERLRVSIDRGWIIGFILTLFAIHVARMGFDRSLLGIFSPAFAVLGDLFVALVLAFIIIMPGGTLWRRLTASIDRWAWPRVLDDNRGWLRSLSRLALRRRLRMHIRLRQTRYSLRAALSRGLQTGLPVSAIIAATAPVWGMSWYFDTENWAAGVWNSWAEERTDAWRVAMTTAVQRADAPTTAPATRPSQWFAVHPQGIEGDFSFIVIGDTGEGDASQHSLRAAYLDVAKRDDVKFVVISSDVVYPTGAMRDYEAKFWIPFMGTTKPVYAIPGNHDWYDALEGFAATFFTPHAARASMIARFEADHLLTKRTGAYVDRVIATATRFRHEYGVPTQQQLATYFQVQSPSFALFAIDTGVAKRIDPAQLNWLEAGLESAAGKTKMAILGHPLFAAGAYQAGDNEDFAALHALLRKHQVAIVMAGDTHDLEYYREAPTGGLHMHHFVNGGGGAYLSFGTSLAFPEKPATADWAYFPTRRAVTDKISATTPWWKWPAWWWTRTAGAWPFSAEFLSAAFDSNVSPFYQSFVEVRVEPSAGRVRIIPYGVNGRLHWHDFDRSASVPTGEASADALAEWVVPLRSN